MTNDEKKKLYQLLSAPFPEEAIERTKGRVTGKGYDTAGVRAQFLITRLNEVLGLGCYRIHRTIEVRPITTPKGRTMYEAVADMTVEIGEWVDGQWVVAAENISDGGFIAATMFDAKKGAHTNALKRCLAGFGIGKAAWEGALDDDSQPGDDHSAPVTTVVRAPVITAAVPVPPGYTQTPEVPAPQPDRNRLSSRQLSAIWSIARKLGVEQSGFRSQVRTKYGVQLEFLGRNQASELITSLNARLNSNGNGQHTEEQGIPAGTA